MASATDTIVVNASATLAAGVGAHFNLVVDGVVVGDATVGTALQGYSFATTLTPGQPHDIKIAYDNDAYINGQDRNLLLQSIAIDGQVVNATDSREVYHATSGPGDLPSDGTMAWNGNAEFSLPASFFATPALPPTPVPTPAPTPTPTPVPTGTDTIVVNASATLAAGVGAHFNLVVDGVVVGDATVGTALQGYSFATTLTPGQPHDIKITYDNDAYINGQDRNLLLQSIAIDGQVVNATDSREVYHATSGPGDLPSDGTMAWNGNAEFSLPASFFATPALPPTPVPTPAPTPTPTPTPTPAPTGTDTIVVNASATLAAGVGAHFNLVVDGVVVGDATVGTALQGYSFATTLTPGQPHDIKIAYDNDAYINGQDRNLLLQSISIDGQVVNATDSREVYHATSGPGDLPSDGTMAWNGNAEFSLPASFFATPAPTPTPVPTPAPTGAAFYVATSGSDSGDGSIAHPFATLAHAKSAMEGSSVHTAYIEGGTYNINSAVLLNGADSGMSFIAYNGQAPVLDGGAGGLANLMSLNGASGVTVSGLTFANIRTGSGALLLANAGSDTVTDNHFVNIGTGIELSNSSNNVISGNEIDNAAANGIEAHDNSNSNLIDSNLINGVNATGVTGAGINLHGANYNILSHNFIENTAGIGIGIQNWDSSTINVGNKVTYNEVLNTGTNTPYDTGAIYVLGRSQVDTQTLISNNYIDKTGAGGDAHTIGIYLDDYTSGVQVTSNIVRDPGTHAVQTHGGSNISISNNIFDLGNTTTSTVLFQGLNTTPVPQNQSFSQNIVYTAAPFQTLFTAIFQPGSPNVSDNLYWDTIGGHMQNYSPTLDSNPQYGDPNFQNASAGNYALGAGSAASAIGFQAINQSAIGLHPTTAHWYS